MSLEHAESLCIHTDSYFFAFHSNLQPLLPSVEATVASAIDPISLAADCLAETAGYIETEVREAIEETLASGGTAFSSSPASSQSDTPSQRPILSSPVSHSKQFSLASTRLSSVCSTFRAVSLAFIFLLFPFLPFPFTSSSLS